LGDAKIDEITAAMKPKSATSPLLFLRGQPRTWEERGGKQWQAVNGANAPVKSQLNIVGIDGLSPDGKAITLTASHLSAENSFADPKKVSPVVTTLTDVSARMHYTFPARSLVILRLHPKG
jgi:alpha-L-arabinofuranosidase